MDRWGFLLMANPILEDFEQYVDLGSTKACKLIGIAYPTYAAYRSGSRSLPQYHENHVNDLYRLSQRELRQLIQERTQ